MIKNEEAHAMARGGWRRGRVRVFLLALSCMLALGCGGSQAAYAAPAWKPITSHYPTNFAPGGVGHLVVNAWNVGDSTSVAPPTVDVSLPPGLTATGTASLGWTCPSLPASSFTCTYLLTVKAGELAGALFQSPLDISIDVAPAASGVVDGAVTVSSPDAGASTAKERVAIGASPAPFGVQAFDGQVTRDAAGRPETRAGAHPYSASATIIFNTDENGVPVEMPKTIRTSLPLGFVGNPTIGPQCTAVQLTNNGCAPASQVGLVELYVDKGTWFATQPVYNMVPADGVPAQFGFRVSSGIVNVLASVRPEDYGLDISAINVDQTVALTRTDFTFWGVPADPVHDARRGMLSGLESSAQHTARGGMSPCPNKSGLDLAPFLTNPTSCTEPGVGVETKLASDSWTNPGVFDHASFFSHLPPGLPDRGPQQGPEDCERLDFDPSFTAVPDTSMSDAPSGLEIDLSFPQDAITQLESRSGAHLKRASVLLPEGMTINPSAGDGLAGCSDEQLALGEDRPVDCPSGSKIGTVTAKSPLLEETLSGGVYVGTQRSDDPASGEMFRLFLNLVSQKRGVDVKLAGNIAVDPETGRIRTTFDENPQLPVSSVSVRLKSGARAPLATPASCGAKTIEARFESWGGQVAERQDSFTIDCPGADGFAPVFGGGSVNVAGGRFSPFVAQIDRRAGEQFLSGVAVDLPKGLLAKVRGVALCSSFAAENGGCPEASRIGTATAGAGAGAPFFLDGPVYLTEGYKGAPYGLAVHVHAKAGPFDLGWVRVRQAAHVDPATAEVSVASDPLPRIVKGVPVRLRHVTVDVDRPGFTFNPTSCAAREARATLTSIQGTERTSSARFQVGDCAALKFKPRLAMRMTGKHQIRTGKHPGVKAVVRQTGFGESGIERAVVRLPKSLALDPENAQALCEFEDGTKPDLEKRCPKGSIVGRAKAVTPLLERPLAGNVYFVKNVRRDPKTGNAIRTLPMIVVALRGEIAINLKGESSTMRDGRLVNTFANVPDAPISRFHLSIDGGSRGILAVTRTRRARINLCSKPRSHVAEADMDGHNSKRHDFDVRIKAPCVKRATGKQEKSGAR